MSKADIDCLKLSAPIVVVGVPLMFLEPSPEQPPAIEAILRLAEEFRGEVIVAVGVLLLISHSKFLVDSAMEMNTPKKNKKNKF